MNRLQGLQSPDTFLVTLNDRERLDGDRVVAVMHYEHPIYTPDAVRAQSRLERPRHRPHGVCRGLPRLGIPRGRLPFRRRGRPALRGGLVSTNRADLPSSRRLSSAGSPTGGTGRFGTPSGTGSTNGSSTSTLSTGDGLQLRFRSADHLGDPRRTIKANVEKFLALNGIPLRDGGRVLMLANARVLGHVFNPLSVFWCYHGSGQLAASSPRCTTRTASGMHTSCIPTRTGSR